MINLKRELKNVKVSIGSWLTIGDTAVAEIMSKAGFDWLVVDMEHSAITLSQTQQLIQVIGLSGIVPLVRVGENNPNLIKRVMDAGAYGVIVPMINTKEEAIKAINAVKYPPLGTRGVGLARAQGYGLEFEEYKKRVNKESIVIVQIEHIEAINNLDKILSLNEVDGFLVGPYDLSASLGKPGDFKNPELRDAFSQIIKTGRRYHKAAGFHVIKPDAKEALQKIKEGYRFIVFSLDTLFLGTKCKEELSRIVNPNA